MQAVNESLHYEIDRIFFQTTALFGRTVLSLCEKWPSLCHLRKMFVALSWFQTQKYVVGSLMTKVFTIYLFSLEKCVVNQDTCKTLVACQQGSYWVNVLGNIFVPCFAIVPINRCDKIHHCIQIIVLKSKTLSLRLIKLNDQGIVWWYSKW